MAVTITGSDGIDAVQANTIVTSDIADGNITQSKIASGVTSTGPAFSAHNGGNQSISSNTDTKVQFPSEDFDTNSCYDNSTYTFTPNVAGYYELNCTLYQSNASGSYWYMRFYKNGGFWVEGFRRTQTGQSAHSSSTLVYANGTTDYFQVNVYSSGAGLSLGASNAGFMRFSGSLVRAA